MWNNAIFFEVAILAYSTVLSHVVSQTKNTLSPKSQLLESNQLSADENEKPLKAVRHRRDYESTYESDEVEFELTPEEVKLVYQEVPHIAEDMRDAVEHLYKAYKETKQRRYPEDLRILLENSKKYGEDVLNMMEATKESLQELVGAPMETLPPTTPDPDDDDTTATEKKNKGEQVQSTNTKDSVEEHSGSTLPTSQLAKNLKSARFFFSYH